MGNVHNYEEIKDLLFGKDRSRPLHPEDDDLDEIIAKVLQKVEVEARRSELEKAHAAATIGLDIPEWAIHRIIELDPTAALRNQTGVTSDE